VVVSQQRFMHFPVALDLQSLKTSRHFGTSLIRLTRKMVDFVSDGCSKEVIGVTLLF